ncbi:hypothetical protein B0A68_13825 [Flavobacterium reichenbachii]|nr:hypothetical protein B0A68_13825 [Flavobacterium reichenbachii]
MIFFDLRRFVHQMWICRSRNFICDFTKLVNQICFLIKSGLYNLLKLLKQGNSSSTVLASAIVDKG